MCKKNVRFFSFMRFAALAMVLAVLAASCGTSRGQLYPKLAKDLVWPHPPEKPRIKYLGQFRSEDDLKREVSGFEALGRLVFGRDAVGVFARPHALCKDDHEKLYVADSSGSVVHILDFTTRKYAQFFNLDAAERLISPVGLTVADNKIYVADSILKKVCVFDKEGDHLSSFGAGILERPAGLAFSPQQQMLYVADAKLHTVTLFDLQGRHLGNLSQPGGQQHKFNFPTHLWVDKDGKLYVSDTLNYRIQIFSPKGEYLYSLGQHGNRPGYFAHPCGIATDSFGNIYVSDKQFENVQIFNSAGQILMSFGNEGNEPGEFWLPAAIFIDSKNRIYVADSFNQRIQVFQLLED